MGTALAEGTAVISAGPGEVLVPPVPVPLQLLETDGSVVDGATELIAELALTPEDLLTLHRLMATTRALDGELMALQRQGQLALYPPCLGQEAAQIGSALAVAATDWVVPQYRELAVFLARGIAPASIGMLWRGAVHGPPGMIEHRTFSVAIPIGTQMVHAAGCAMASVLTGDGAVTLAYCGDGGMSEGDASEGLNLAGSWGAPLVTVVQNNQWAISTRPGVQSAAASIAHRAIGFGARGVRVDGNDVLAMLHATRDAVARARKGLGPTLIEAVTYRMGPHTTSDDPTRYRSAEEVAAWAERDPIARFESFLRGQGVLDDSAARETTEEAYRACSELRAAVFDAPDPDPLSLFEHVSEPAEGALAGQRDALRAELAALAEQAAGG